MRLDGSGWTKVGQEASVLPDGAYQQVCQATSESGQET